MNLNWKIVVVSLSAPLASWACAGAEDEFAGEDNGTGGVGDVDGGDGGMPPGDGDGDSLSATGGTSSPDTCSNCSNGCCDGDTCIPFAIQTTTQCGLAGESCSSCEFGLLCDAGSCGVDEDICSEHTCQGCCADSGECVEPFDTNWQACGGGGEECGSCDYGVVCGVSGECTDQIASDTIWQVTIHSAEAYATNTDGNWDLDGSAPELSVCIAIDDVRQECASSPSACTNSYTCSFEKELTAVVTGQQLADGALSLSLYDEDLDTDDFAGGWYVTHFTVPIDHAVLLNTATTLGAKRITYSIK